MIPTNANIFEVLSHTINDLYGEVEVVITVDVTTKVPVQETGEYKFFTIETNDPRRYFEFRNVDVIRYKDSQGMEKILDGDIKRVISLAFDKAEPVVFGAIGSYRDHKRSIGAVIYARVVDVEIPSPLMNAMKFVYGIFGEWGVYQLLKNTIINVRIRAREVHIVRLK